MNEAKKNAWPITIRSADGYETPPFANTREIREWLEEEKNMLVWNDGFRRNIRDTYLLPSHAVPKFWEELDKYITNYDNVEDDNKRDDLILQIKNLKAPLTSKSRYGQFLLLAREKYKNDIASLIPNFLINPTFRFLDRRLNFNFGVVGGKEAFTQFIERSIKAIALAIFCREGSEFVSLQREHRKIIEELNQESEKARKEVASSKEEIERYTISVKERIAVDESFEQWLEKSKSHKWSKWGMAFLLGFAIVAIPIVFYYLFYTSLTKVTLENFNIGDLSGAILFSTLGIWLVRFLVKIFISHQHLQIDAEERVTMIKTYLALLQDKTNPLQTEDRKLILESIFRHSASGFIKEDSSSPTPLNILTPSGRG